MRTATALLLVALAALAAACGPADLDGARGKPACPPGEVTVQEVVGEPAPGYELVRGDKKTTEAYEKIMREALGEELRGSSTRVHIRKQAMYGTGVMAVNSATPLDGFLEGAMKGGRETAKKAVPLTIAGNEGVLLHAQDGTFFATAEYGRCSIVALYSHREKLLRTTAEQLPAAPDS